MKGTSKRLLSTLLVVALLFSLFAAIPLAASAAEPKPTNLEAKRGEKSIILTWTSNAVSAVGFHIERKKQNGDWVHIRDVNVSITTWEDKASDPNGPEEGYLYTYRVRSYTLGNVEQSPYSNEADRAWISYPAPATDLKATTVAGGIALTWKDNSDNETAFHIFRAPGSNASFHYGNYYIDEVGANKTTWVDTTAVMGETYTYAVAAFRSMGTTGTAIDFNNKVTITMGAPAAPSDLTATADATGITLTWTNNATTANFVAIERKEGDGEWIKPFSDFPASSTTYIDATYVDTTAQPGKTYTYRVKALSNAYGNSDYSNEATAIMGSESAEVIDTTTTSSGMANFVKVNTYTHGLFTDVNENQWYGFSQQKVIASAYEYGLMMGNSATIFDPTGNITVAQAITMATRVHKIYTTGKGDFVQVGTWYQVYVDYAVANDIIAANDFADYNRNATRAEMAFIFSRSLTASEFGSPTPPNIVNSLPDVNSGTPYRDSIFMLYKAGILTGSDDKGTFNPGSNINRAEAAAIISRVILPLTRAKDKKYE